MSPPALDWSDRAAVSGWLKRLRETLEQHQGITKDMLRPPHRRELGPALHRVRARETEKQLRQLLDFATGTEPARDSDAFTGG